MAGRRFFAEILSVEKIEDFLIQSPKMLRFFPHGIFNGNIWMEVFKKTGGAKMLLPDFAILQPDLLKIASVRAMKKHAQF